MQVRDVDEPVTYTKGPDPLAGTPIMDWVKESRARGLAAGKEGLPKEVQVPATKADHLVDLIRRAAARQGLGVKFQAHRQGNPGHVIIKFEAKAKRVNSPKE